MDTHQSSIERAVTRRALLRLAGVAGIGSMLASCAAPQAATPAPPVAPTAPAKPTAPPAAAAPPKPAATTAPAAATAVPAKPKTLAKWRYGTFAANLQDSPFYFGIDRGWFGDEGLEIEITNLTSDVTAMQGLAAGEFDFISLNLLGEIALIAGGAPLKVLGSSAAGLNQVTVSRKEITSVKDLSGKSMGHSGPGSLPDIIADLILEKYGVNLSSVTKTNAGATPARLAAVLEGKLDATQLTLDDVPKIQEEGKLNILSINAEDLPDYVTSGVAVAEKTLTDRASQVEGLLRATTKSIRALYDSRPQVVKLMADKIKREEAAVGPAFDLYVKYKIWPKNLELTAQQLDYMQQINVRLGRQPQKLPTERIANFSSRDKVISALGKAG